MITYTPSNQLTLEGFTHPFDQALSPENRWVKLSRIIPWDSLAEVYAQSLSSTSGRQSIDIRMVIGALIVKHKLGLDDRGTVAMISENIYLQYFCGLGSFQTQLPFHPTVFVDIRKRMGASRFDHWNALVIAKADGLKPKSKQTITKQTKEDLPPKPKGTLKIDATIADQKIVYPTDVGLLNRAREETERMIDMLYKLSSVAKKPRDYRRVARKSYLSFSKKRNKPKQQLRKQIRQQLNYVKRNLGYIEELLDTIALQRASEDLPGTFMGLKDPFPERWPLSDRDQKLYWVIQHLYEQQKYMHEQRVNTVSDRIVNLYQPYVRPMPRGKDKSKTEFGAKISASEVDGMSRVEHISWDSFNESVDVELQAKNFLQTYGHYPELLLADQIYLNRKNRKWLNEKGIRIVGKPLGRPKKQELSAYQKRKRKKEQNQRNHIEGKFGQGKNAYGLANIQAKRSDTSQSWIACIFFVMNLVSLGKIAEKYAIFCAFLKKWLDESLGWLEKLYNQPKPSAVYPIYCSVTYSKNYKGIL